MKVAASIANTTPKPASATSRPASAGPKIETALFEMPISAFASWSRVGFTSDLTSPVEAGPKNADAAPNSTEEATRCHTAMESVKNASAITPWTSARTRSAAIITSCPAGGRPRRRLRR